MLVQQCVGGSASGSVLDSGMLTTSAAGFLSATTPGNLLVLVLYIKQIGNAGGLAYNGPNISGGYSQNWAAVGVPSAFYQDSVHGLPFGTEGTVSIYYIPNAPSMSLSQLTTVEYVNESGVTTTTSIEFDLYEYDDIANPLVTDLGVNGKSKNSQTSSTPNITFHTATVNKDLMIVAYQSDAGSNLSAGSGYTLGENATVATLGQMQYQVNAPIGQTSASFSGAPLANWCLAAVSFKAAVSVVPTLVSVSPTSGPSGGGQSVIITGTNFNSDATVSFGGNLATNVVVISSTEITCVTPVHFPGTVDVKVTEAAGSVTATNAYTYTASKVPLTMNFQDAGGNPLSYGNVTFTLNTDAVTITGQQINAGRVVSFTLDVNGNLFGPLWPTDQMTSDSISPNTTYRVKAYTAEGQLCFEQDMVIST